MEQQLPAELCSLVSLGGVSWLTADFPLLGRIFLILLDISSLSRTKYLLESKDFAEHYGN